MTDSTDAECKTNAQGTVTEVFVAFLKLGLTSFGGPIAHLGYFRTEFVERRRWLDDRGYSDLVTLCQFLPGPASSQVAWRWAWDGRDGRACWPQQRQIWIGAAIGITPVMARLQALIVQPDGRKIDPWCNTAEPTSEFIERLSQLAVQAGVRLHVLVTERDGRLTTERLRAAIPDWRDASIWFCGPTGLGRALREGLAERGLNKNNFHRELFDMR